MAQMAFFELEGWEKSILKKYFPKHKLLFFNEPLAEKHLQQIKNVEILGVFIYSKISKEVLAKLPKLKMIATFSTGFDHIDLVECKKRKIIVSNVPSYGSHTVAEHTIALMLALAKKLVPSIDRTRAGNFSLEGLRTFDIVGKTLGLIGFGKIGSHVAKVAKALGMNVIIYDPYADENLVDLLDCKKVDLDYLLKHSDIISLHAPLNEQTRHIINKETIAKMKNGVILINTARGGLVDSKALLDGLLSKKIAGAGLDVLEEETAIREEKELLAPDYAKKHDLHTVVITHMLREHQNVIITPHNAFNSKEALERIVYTSAENISKFLEGRPQNLVYK
ncbi:MAG: hydroxyacid dehydrogenase [Candidatus Micrarchaeota archaeon]|nr:hydroxyacid dehydrogenase [Candidatus Micrarchaeota archaeon]